MPIMNRETKGLPLLAAYPFAAEHGLADEAAEIRELDTGSSVRRGHIAHLFREKGLLEVDRRSHLCVDWSRPVLLHLV